MMPAMTALLERRRIEAEIVKPIYQALVQEIGAERARELLARVVRALAQDAGRRFAEQHGGKTDLRTFAEIIPLWQEGGALEITFREQSENALAFDVTRCRYAEMYESLGIRELGPVLSCGRDGGLCEGFNPRIRLSRTQTIMQGARCCDFRYTIEDGSAPPVENSTTD